MIAHVRSKSCSKKRDEDASAKPVYSPFSKLFRKKDAGAGKVDDRYRGPTLNKPKVLQRNSDDAAGKQKTSLWCEIVDTSTTEKKTKVSGMKRYVSYIIDVRSFGRKKEIQYYISRRLGQFHKCQKLLSLEFPELSFPSIPVVMPSGDVTEQKVGFVCRLTFFFSFHSFFLQVAVLGRLQQLLNTVCKNPSNKDVIKSVAFVDFIDPSLSPQFSTLRGVLMEGFVLFFFSFQSFSHLLLPFSQLGDVEEDIVEGEL